MQLRGRAREASREGNIEMRPEDEGERWRVDEKSRYQAELGQEDFSGGGGTESLSLWLEHRWGRQEQISRDPVFHALWVDFRPSPEVM